MKLSIDRDPRRGKPSIRILDEYGNERAIVNPYHDDVDRFAKVLCAAPDLLAACEMLMAYYRSCTDQGNTAPVVEFIDALDAAQDAVAKVRGQGESITNERGAL